MNTKLPAPPGRGRTTRAFTLIETVVSIGICGFLFLFLAGLTFLAARNTAVIHAQALAQTSAASASERIATELRQAMAFERFPDDAATGNRLKKVRYLIPGEGSDFSTRALLFDEATSEVRIHDLTVAGELADPPRHVYRHLTDLSINWESEFRLTVTLTYQYRGFALYLNDPGHPQFGQFVTDIIAKNHFMDQGVENYALSDNPTSGPATL